VDRAVLERMRDVMITRGPDDAGLHIEPHVGLGHRRLSIIDLSAAGRQPMANEDRTVWIVFNGEIYNFLELRDELAHAGHAFGSRTDAEVLVHGYEEWGLAGLVERILGMFALAIWDRRARRLHLVRDHLGKKPVFYNLVGGRVVFASDIKAIWIESNALGGSGKLEIDERAIDEFLYYAAISQNRTIWRGVHKLPPAHVASFHEGGVELRRYWSPDYTRKAERSVSQWLEGMDFHLRRAVRRRLIADVPLGGFLSGGVDSSTVCALMAAEGKDKPRTFSVGFEASLRYDERKYSRMVAEHIGSVHTELVPRPDVAPILSSIVWHCGEPFGDSSMIPTYLIAREARRHVTVVLTGDGGDETFAGYSRHLRASRDRRYAALTPLVRKGLVPLLARVVRAMAPTTLFARNIDMSAKYLAGHWASVATDTTWFDGLRDRLYSGGFKRRLGGFHPLRAQREFLMSLGGPTNVDRAIEYLMLTTLPNDYLVKVDVATMAHSLEARSPLLDKELIEFAATIPSEVLTQGNQAKALLKRYASGLVPSEVIYRKKQGFAVPIRHWFRQQWREPLRRILLSEQCLGRGYFERSFVKKVVDEHTDGGRNHAPRLWTLLVLELWHRLFVDGTLSSGDPVL
jgi:asparagine synthase (glutamine-hydrolysing)